MSKGGNNNNNFYYDENLISMDDAYQGFNNYNNNNNLNNFNDFELYNLNRDDPFINDYKNLNTNNFNNNNKKNSQNSSLRTSKTNSVNNSIKSINNSNNSLKSINNSTNNSNRDSGDFRNINNINNLKMNNNSNRAIPRNGQIGGGPPQQPPPKNLNSNGYHNEINGNKNFNNNINNNKPVNNRLKPLNQNSKDSFEMIEDNSSRQPMTKNSNKPLKQPAQQQTQPQPGGAKPVKNLQIIDNNEANQNGQQNNSNVKLPKSNSVRLNNFEINPELKKNLELKTRNNQSSFAKNPTNSYSLQYYGSFPQNVIKPKFKVPPFIEGLSPRELVYNYPYVLPAAAPIIAPIPIPAAYAPLPYHRYNNNKKEVAPKVDTHLYKNNNKNNDKKNQFNTTDYLYNYYPYPSPYSEYYSPAGILPYNIYIKPEYPNDDKDPSIHELLYYDSQRNKDGLHLKLYLFDFQLFTFLLLNMYINSFLCNKTHREKD